MNKKKFETMDRDNLKIEFRAVPYGEESHVLEYRISPKQDITYYKEKRLFGIFKYRRKCEYSTSWQKIMVFECGLTSHYYDVDKWINYMPIFCNNQDTLDWFKRTFQTLGAFEEYIVEREKPELEKYWAKRQKRSEKKIFY